jgi:hypothetical protein
MLTVKLLQMALCYAPTGNSGDIITPSSSGCVAVEALNPQGHVKPAYRAPLHAFVRCLRGPTFVTSKLRESPISSKAVRGCILKSAIANAAFSTPFVDYFECLH